MKHDAWPRAGQALDNGGHKSGSQHRVTSDAHVASRRIGEKFDILHAFSQLVKNGESPLEQRGAIDRWLGTMAIALKYAHAKHLLKVRDRLRYDGLGNGQMLRRLRHALALHDGEKDVEVAQPNAATNAIRP